MNEQKTKASGLALLPILVFLVLFLGTGIILDDFYTMPAVVGFLIALIVAFLQTKGKTFSEKVSIVAKGVGDDNIITMCLIFLAAGAFSGAVSAAGGVSSTVNLGLSLLPPQIAVIGLFITAALFPFPWVPPWEPSLPWRLSPWVFPKLPGFLWQSVSAPWFPEPCSATTFP